MIGIVSVLCRYVVLNEDKAAKHGGNYQHYIPAKYAHYADHGAKPADKKKEEKKDHHKDHHKKHAAHEKKDAKHDDKKKDSGYSHYVPAKYAHYANHGSKTAATKDDKKDEHVHKDHGKK